jgi:hypothetical protein
MHARDLTAFRSDTERALRESGERGLLLFLDCVIRRPVSPDVLDATAGLIRGENPTAKLGFRN